MSQGPDQVQEVDRLLIALAEDAIDPAGMRRLEQLLADDPAARQKYYRYMSMHASLGWRFGVAQGETEQGAADTGVLLQIMEDQARFSQACEEQDAAWMAQLEAERVEQQSRLSWLRSQNEETSEARRVIVIPRVLVYLGIAACLLIAGIVGVQVFKPSPPAPQVVEQPTDPDPEVQALAPIVAHVQSSVDARWIGLAPGESKLRSETPLTLSDGFAEIELLDGARVVVQAPAVFELTGRNTLRLASGKLVATVPESATGFVVVTANARITDLGTEFGVAAAHDGGYQAHVFQGEITLAPTGSAAGGASGPLLAGEAVAVSGRGHVRTAEADELAFVRSEEYTAIHAAPNSPAARWLAYTYTLRRDAALLAYYSFDDNALTSGSALNLAERTQGRFDATLGDGREMTVPSPGADRFGQAGQALSFDRRRGQALYVDDWPEVGDLDALTISCWFRLEDNHGPWALLVTQWHDAFDQGDRHAFHLGLRDARTMPGPPGQTYGLHAHVSTDGITSQDPGWDIKDEPSHGGETTPRDGWVHVVLTVECGGGAVRMYKDGVEIDFDGARYHPEHLPWTRHPLVIGGKATLRGGDLSEFGLVSGFFHGEIDDVAIFRRALASEEVHAMYDAGAAIGATGASPPR